MYFYTFAHLKRRINNEKNKQIFIILYNHLIKNLILYYIKYCKYINQLMIINEKLLYNKIFNKQTNDCFILIVSKDDLIPFNINYHHYPISECYPLTDVYTKLNITNIYLAAAK